MNQRTNPSISWRLSLVTQSIVMPIGALTLTPNSSFIFVLVWGAAVGIGSGWYYATTNLIFSLAQPKGQETEFAGFYTCSEAILSWAPPLVYSALVEAGAQQNHAVMCVVGFFMTGVVIMSFASPWEEIIAESHKVISNDEDHRTPAEMEQIQDVDEEENA
mmetsp:Transcript_2159/g.3058  ORF Transcript_2159/g.3058 Transcript_2159/m.3058 type:complete len:161 (+) Transcript_2159:523-1005(+)